MAYELKTQEKKYVIGIGIHTSNEKFQIEGVPLWGRFLNEKIASLIPNKTDQNILGVYHNYEGDHTEPFSFLIGCEVSTLDTIPEGMVGLEIPSSSYAIFTAKGEFPQSMMAVWKEIWKSDIKRAFSYDFEVYTPDFNPQNSPEVKVFISVK